MENKRIIAIYLIGVLLIAAIIYLITRPLMSSASESMLITDAIMCGVLLAGVLTLLKIIVKYSNLSSLYLYQKLTVYIALAVLFVLCWFGIEFLLLYLIFPTDDWLLFSPSVPVRILVGVLTYGFAIQLYLSFYKKERQAVEDNYQGNNLAEESDSALISENESNQSEKLQERIAVKNGQKIDVIMVSEIVYLQAEGDYVMIHSVKGKYLKEQTMKSFEEFLPSSQFVRVHRSSIVNVDFIAQIELYDKQNQLLKMQNGAQVKVSISGYRILKKTLGLK
ncbi:LytR/AlgR family response regulator transcription factor [Dysgonomonas sp. ZJ279]|uniref:LytR/AlgR family response regulator transcription factor n=1 Tax=Dysgonomonas sp. ZJ279 TaxID=2709796 RepID=UPI0013EC5BD3|nr:LytTR family DNA-binding domain-containing protein [Dysgonomonas sp. ZJ279]